MVKDCKWLIDNTALSNFALINRIDLLSDFFKDNLAITQEVRDEFLYGITTGKIPKKSNLEWIELVSFNNDQEKNLFDRLKERFGKGES